jgi:hypothetical protein
MLFINPATYGAFCRNNGDHSTPAVGKVNWNAEIISKMRDDLIPQWQDWEEEIQEHFSVFLTTTKHELSALKKSVLGKTEKYSIIQHCLLSRC